MRAAEACPTTLPKMTRSTTPDRPGRTVDTAHRKDSEQPTEVNPESPAYYLIHAPSDTPLREIYDAWQFRVDPAIAWGKEVGDHSVLKRVVHRPDGSRGYFRCGFCGEHAESRQSFEAIDCDRRES